MTWSWAGGIGTLASASFSNNYSETLSWPLPGLSKASSNTRPFVRWLLATDLAFFRNLLRHNRSFLYSSSSLSWTWTSLFGTVGMVARFFAISPLLKPSKIPSFFALAISLSLFSWNVITGINENINKMIKLYLKVTDHQCKHNSVIYYMANWSTTESRIPTTKMNRLEIVLANCFFQNITQKKTVSS